LAPYRTIHRRADAHFEQIEVTSLDQDLAEAHLPEPDLIKVDAEGYELAVPGGAKRLLEARHTALYLEMITPDNCESASEGHLYCC
jgi:FkbM family methyltransferase